MPAFFIMLAALAAQSESSAAQPEGGPPPPAAYAPPADMPPPDGDAPLPPPDGHKPPPSKGGHKPPPGGHRPPPPPGGHAPPPPPPADGYAPPPAPGGYPPSPPSMRRSHEYLAYRLCLSQASREASEQGTIPEDLLYQLHEACPNERADLVKAYTAQTKRPADQPGPTDEELVTNLTSPLIAVEIRNYMFRYTTGRRLGR